MRLLLLGFCICTLLLAAHPNQVFASLIGDTIVADAIWVNAVPNPNATLLNGAVAVVDAAATEFSVGIPFLGGSDFEIDFFDDETFSIFFNPADAALWPTDVEITLSDLDWVDGPGFLTSVVQTSAISETSGGTNPAVGLWDVISFTANSISLDSSVNDHFGTRFTAVYAYTAGHGPGPPGGEIPEPSTILLLASGLAGLAGWRWRKNRTA